LGTYRGIRIIGSNPELFMPTFIGAMVLELILFFVARGVAENGNNSVALPLLATYSLLSGYTLSGLVYVALGQSGVGITGVGIAALGCGVTFVVARQVGSNLSDRDGIALAQTVRIGMIALLVVLLGQVVFTLFGVYTPNYLEIAISGIATLLFAGCAVVDFYVLPRTYRAKSTRPAKIG
jgi:uncharacterized protein